MVFTINVQDNIASTRQRLMELSQEIARLEGVLATFMNFKQGGVEVIECPNDPMPSAPPTNPNTESSMTLDKIMEDD